MYFGKGSRFVVYSVHNLWAVQRRMGSRSQFLAPSSSSPEDDGEVLCEEWLCSVSVPFAVPKSICKLCVCLLLQGGCLKVEDKVQVPGTGGMEA